MSKNIVCACPFCNQIIDHQKKTFSSQDEAEKYAMTQCICREAFAMTTAKATIAEMFEDAPDTNNEALVILLDSLAKSVVDGLLKKISVNVSRTTTVTIAESKKSTLSIVKTDKHTQEWEI